MSSTSKLFSFVQSQAGTRTAVVISSSALTSLALQSLRDSAAYFTNVTLPTNVSGIVVTPLSISVDPQKLGTHIQHQNGEFGLAIDHDFEITLAISTDTVPSYVLSTVTYKVEKAFFGIEVAAPELRFVDADFTLTPDLVEAATRPDGLAASSLSDREIMRIEGALAYLMGDRIVADILGQIAPVNLQKILTAFELHGEWALKTDDENLVVIPDGGITINAPSKCPETDTVGDLTFGNDYSGTVIDKAAGTASWVLAVKKPAPAVVPGRPPSQKDPFIGIYLPKPTLEHRFTGIRPGFPIAASGGGFINWTLTGSVWLDWARLQIDVATASLLLDIEVHGDAHANVSVKVPCVGNRKIARADALLGPSTVSVRFHFDSSDESRLVLRAEVVNISMGKVEVDIELFAKWLGIAGGKALVVGLILDEIMRRVVEHNLPIELRKAIKDEINKQNVELLDLVDFRERTQYGFNYSSFAGDDTAILIGLLSDG